MVMAPRWSRAPVSPADLDGASCFGVLPEVPVEFRALHSGHAHEFAYFCPFFGSYAKREPERVFGGSGLAGGLR
jgi:hypothetical protein